ncbi:MAG: hypothetical protein KGL53_13815, partial [Elusimicrobia bacterium]|nr:hypothetical protein [Elusimicrobiota bacterium]
RSDQGNSYLDLDGVQVSAGVLDPQGLLGVYNKNGGPQAVSKVRDLEVLPMVLNDAGWSASSAKLVTEVRGLLEKAGSGSSFSLSGTVSGGGAAGLRVAVVDSAGKDSEWCLTADKAPKPCGSGQPGGENTAPQQGFEMSPALGQTQLSGDAPFGESTEVTGVDGTLQRVAPRPKDGTAALYLLETGGKRQWFLSFAVSNTWKDKSGTQSQRMKTFPTYVFSNGNDRPPLPPKISIGGVSYSGEPPAQVKEKVVKTGKTVDAGGYIGAYRGESNDSCIGVVAWWGTTRKAACEDCGAKWAGSACVPQR